MVQLRDNLKHSIRVFLSGSLSRQIDDLTIKFASHDGSVTLSWLPSQLSHDRVITPPLEKEKLFSRLRGRESIRNQVLAIPVGICGSEETNVSRQSDTGLKSHARLLGNGGARRKARKQ